MDDAGQPVLSTDWAWKRIQRLRLRMAEQQIGTAFLHNPVSVKHLTGASSMHGWPCALLVGTDVVVGFFFANGEQQAACDVQVVHRGIRHDCLVRHPDALADATRPHLAKLAREAETIGIEAATAPGWLSSVLGGLDGSVKVADLSGALTELRRCKDPDELAVIQYNVRLSQAAYSAARDAIHPGVTEVEVHQTMSRAVHELAGTAVPFGGDFMAGPGGGETGGSPSNRVLEDGESYVIDFWPWLGGYFSDMCRTFPVGNATPRLREAIGVTIAALELAEHIVKPGVRAADVDSALRTFLRGKPELGGDGYRHISGHGLGILPHEAPWIISESSDVFQAGEVIALEPGLYAEALAGGARTEDSYVITPTGVMNLCDFPRNLT